MQNPRRFVALVSATFLAVAVVGFGVGRATKQTSQVDFSARSVSVGPPGATVTDAQCTAAEVTCAMTFVDDPAKDLDPYTGVAFGQPKPGVMAPDSALTAIPRRRRRPSSAIRRH